MKRIAALLLTALLLVSLAACGGKGTWQEQYDLGMRYLNEGSYQEAVIAFKAAIKIDPKRPEAYLGAAEAYVGLGDTAKAIDILKRGQEQTDDQTIQERLEQLLTLQDSGALSSYGVYSYDERGREIRREFYNADGSRMKAWESEYDAVSGERVKYITYSAENEIEGWTTYYPVREGERWSMGFRLEYDSEGQPILEESESCTFADGEPVQYEKTDSAGGKAVWELTDGRIVRERYYADDGYMAETIYNENLTSIRSYENGILTLERTFEYDDANNTLRRWDWDKYSPDERDLYYWIYDDQGRMLEAYLNGAQAVAVYDADGNRTYTETRSDGELDYTQTETRTAIGIRTTSIDSDGSVCGFWEKDIAGHRIEDDDGYTCTRNADGLPLEVYEDGVLKHSYSYQEKTFTITDQGDGTSKTYSLDGVLLTENGEYNNTLYLYDSEGKLVRTLSFAKTAS